MTDIQAASAISAKPPASPTADREIPMVIERLLGFIAAVSLTLVCILLEGGHMSDFLQPIPYAMVLAIVLGGLIASHGPRRIARMLAVCFGATVADGAERDALRSLCRRGRRLAYAGAALNMITTTLHIISVVDQIEFIGPGIAIGLTSIVFAIALAELGFGSAEHWIKQPPSTT